MSLPEGYKRFRSPHEKEVRVALTSGHVAIIGTEWKPLHPRFHSEAYANRCVSEDMLESREYEKNRDAQGRSKRYEAERKAAKTAIYDMLEKNRVEDFNKSDGKPKTNVLNQLSGLQFNNAERDVVWQEVLDELDNHKGLSKDEEELNGG